MVNQSYSQILLSYSGSTKINSPAVAISYANKRMVTNSSTNSVNSNTPKNIFKNSGTAFSLLYNSSPGGTNCIYNVPSPGVANYTVDGKSVYGATQFFKFQTFNGTSGGCSICPPNNYYNYSVSDSKWNTIWDNTQFKQLKSAPGCSGGYKIRSAVMDVCTAGELFAVPVGNFNSGHCNSNPWISGGLLNTGGNTNCSGQFITGWGKVYNAHNITYYIGTEGKITNTMAVSFEGGFPQNYGIPNGAKKYRLCIIPSS